MSRYVSATVVACTVLLTACSGGGDGDGNVQVASAAADITVDNAPQIAAAVAESVTTSTDLTFIGEFALPAAPVGFSTATDIAPQVLAATFGPESVDCAGGGMLTLSGSLAVPQSLTVGDGLTFEFDQCDDGMGGVSNGSVGFEIVAFSGDVTTGMITLTVSMLLETLQIDSQHRSGTLNGDLSFTIDTTNLPESFVAISSSEFSIVSADSAVVLADYIVTMTIDPTLDSTTLDSSAVLTGTAFDGELSYVTSETLTINAGGIPVAGVIEVSGAGDAQLTIRFLGEDRIELELDSDGNGTVDQIILTSWSGLLG